MGAQGTAGQREERMIDFLIDYGLWLVAASPCGILAVCVLVKRYLQ